MEKNLSESDLKISLDHLRQNISSEANALSFQETHCVWQFITSALSKDWIEITPEIIAGSGPQGSMGLVLVRRRRQLAYSVKFSNLLRDPLVTARAASIASFAAYYIPLKIEELPDNFPGFLITCAFAVFRACAHPIGYGEAALLHHMNQLAETKPLLTSDDVSTFGPILVKKYGYVKGTNSNEVSSLIASLSSWNAIEMSPAGIIVKESVPFGLGPIEYID